MTPGLFPAIRALVHESGVPPKAIAEEAGIRYGYLLRAADDHQDDVQFQARWIGPVTLAAKNDVLIKHLAAACGGVFVRLDHARALDAETASLLREFADYIAAVAEATADRTVSVDEYHRVKAQAHDAIAQIVAHVDGLAVRAGVAERQR